MNSKKSAYLQLRLRPQEKATIQKAAKEAAMDMSAWVLARIFTPGQQRFAACLEALRVDQGDEHKRRYAFAAIDDLFECLRPEEFAKVVAMPPPVSLSPFAINYLTAMVEMTCHRKTLPAPSWATRVPPLAEPYFGTDFGSLRLYLLLNSPPPFRRRNLFIDTGTGGRV